MFRELAGLISRNGKILLAVWVVLLLMAVPPAFKAIDEMGYGISDMADSDSESAIGEEILLSYFDTAVHDAGRTPLIVVSYDSRDGYRQLQGDEEEGIPSFVEYLRKSLQEDKDWSGKLSFDDGAGIVSRAYGDQSSGALLIVLPYVSAYSEDYVIEDTSNLREKISDAMDLFMYELYESEPFFEVYVTGDPALAYDMASEASLSLAVMVLILIVVTLAMTGLFFGSALSSFIAMSSMVVSTILTAAVIFGFCNLIGVFFVPGFLVMLAVMCISFVHSIYVISVFHIEVSSGSDRGSALERTVVRTGNAIVAASACFIVCMLALAYAGEGMFSDFGLCMASGAAIAMLASLTVPASMIHITRNELFWSPRSGRQGFFGRFRGRISRLYTRFRGCISGLVSVRGTAVLLVMVALTACCAYGLDDHGMNEETPYDMTRSLAAGESADGIEVLRAYSDGGLVHPFGIVISYDHPIAYIRSDPDHPGMQMLEWVSYEDIEAVIDLESSLSACDEGNISRTASLFIWDMMIDKAHVAGIEGAWSTIEYIGDMVAHADGSYRAVYDSAVASALVHGFTYETLMSEGGSFMDLAMNKAMGSIGYEMDSDRRVVVDRLMIKVETKESAVSVRSLQTVDSMEAVLDGYRATGAPSEVLLTGAGKVYSETMDSVESGFMKGLLFTVVSLLVILSLVTVSVSVPLRTVATTFMGAVISLFLTDVLMEGMWGSVSLAVQISMLAVCVLMGLWFNSIQEDHIAWCRKHGMSWREASSDLLTTLQPTIIVTSVTLAVCLGTLVFSGIQLMSQLGFALMVCILVDAFVVRTFASPALWSKAGVRARRRSRN